MQFQKESQSTTGYIDLNKDLSDKLFDKPDVF